MYALDDSMDEYMELVRTFPLISIRDDEHLHQATALYGRLVDLPKHSEAQEAYMGALADIIETYENVHVPIAAVTGVEMLRFLMEQNDLKQKDMDAIFGTTSVTSAVLSGARPIGLAHARRLSERFKLPLDVWLATQ